MIITLLVNTSKHEIFILVIIRYMYFIGKEEVTSSVYCMYGHTYSKSMDQPGDVANPARGQLNREISFSLSAFAPENLVSRDGFGSPVPRQFAHLHTQAESGAYLRDSSRVPRRRLYKNVNIRVGTGNQKLTPYYRYLLNFFEETSNYECVLVCDYEIS